MYDELLKLVSGLTNFAVHDSDGSYMIEPTEIMTLCEKR